MSAWSGFLHFIGDLGSWMFGPIEDAIPAFKRDIQSLQDYGDNTRRNSTQYLNRMRAKAAADVTNFTNQYDNIDNALQNVKSNLSSARQELGSNISHNLYTSPVADTVYNVVHKYSKQVGDLSNKLSHLSKALNNATYAQNYYDGRWQALENRLNRTQGEKDSVLGSAMGLLPLLFE